LADSLFLRRTSVLLCALTFCTSAVAQSDTDSNDPADLEMEREVRQLLGAIEKISGYPVPPVLPAIFVTPQHQLEFKLCDRPCNASAAYFPREGIYLAGHLVPLRKTSDRAALVHELVHFLQQGHSKFAQLAGCDRERAKEKEAFDIQNAYSASMGSLERAEYYAGVYECRE
jgi:hypothetical protein